MARRMMIKTTSSFISLDMIEVRIDMSQILLEKKDKSIFYLLHNWSEVLLNRFQNDILEEYGCRELLHASPQIQKTRLLIFSLFFTFYQWWRQVTWEWTKTWATSSSVVLRGIPSIQTILIAFLSKWVKVWNLSLNLLNLDFKSDFALSGELNTNWHSERKSEGSKIDH